MKSLIILFSSLFLLLNLPHSFAEQSKKLATPLKGSVKIKVGVVMGSGDIKYLAKVPFFLTSKSLQDLQLQIYEKNKRLSLEDWLRQQGASSELTQLAEAKTYEWIENIKKTKKISDDPELEILKNGLNYGGYEFIKKYPDIPEFKELLKLADIKILTCRAEGNSMCSARTEETYKSIYFKDTLEQSSYQFLKRNFSYQKYSNNAWFEVNKQAKIELKKFIVASCTTNFDATCIMPAVKTGTYYLTNVFPAHVGSSLIIWDTKIGITPGQRYIELSNDNSGLTKNYATNDEENRSR